MKGNYFIIHGSFSSPFSNWFSWLYGKIESGGGFATALTFQQALGFKTIKIGKNF